MDTWGNNQQYNNRMKNCEEALRERSCRAFFMQKPNKHGLCVGVLSGDWEFFLTQNHKERMLMKELIAMNDFGLMADKEGTARVDSRFVAEAFEKQQIGRASCRERV